MAGFCAQPPADIGFVQGLLGGVDCNVRALSEAGYGALARPDSPVAAALTVLLTLYIGFMGFRMLVGRSPLSVGDLTVSALKVGAVLALTTSWPTYQQLVFDTLFRGPEQLAASMLSALQPQGSAFAGDPFDGLQLAYDQLQHAAGFFSQHVTGTASPLQGGPGGAAFALTASAFLMLITTLGVVLAAKIVLGLLLGLGPVFVCCLLFEATRGIFVGWLRAAIAFALAPLLAVLGLMVQLLLIEPPLSQLVDQRTQGLVQAAPADAILILTLVSTLVSLGLAGAVATIAVGLRLPWASAVRSGPIGGAGRERELLPAALADAGGRQVSVQRPRATAVAAAAAAMSRRESRALLDEGHAPRRLDVAPRRHDGPAGAAGPFGQAYRRTAAQPRRGAAALRRDG